MRIDLLAMISGAFKQAEASNGAEGDSETGQASFHNVISKLTAHHQPSNDSGEADANSPGSDVSPVRPEPVKTGQETTSEAIPVIEDIPAPPSAQTRVDASPMPDIMPGRVENGEFATPAEQNRGTSAPADQSDRKSDIQFGRGHPAPAGVILDCPPRMDRPLLRQMELRFSPAVAEVGEQVLPAHYVPWGEEAPQTIVEAQPVPPPKGDNAPQTGVELQPAPLSPELQKPLIPEITPAGKRPVTFTEVGKQTLRTGEATKEVFTETPSAGTRGDAGITTGGPGIPSSPPQGEVVPVFTKERLTAGMGEGIAADRSIGTNRPKTTGQSSQADTIPGIPGEVARRVPLREASTIVPSGGEKLSGNPQTSIRPQTIEAEPAGGLQGIVPKRPSVPDDSDRLTKPEAADSKGPMNQSRHGLTAEGLQRPGVPATQSLGSKTVPAGPGAAEGIVPPEADRQAAASTRAEGEPATLRAMGEGRNSPANESGSVPPRGYVLPAPEIGTAARIQGDDVRRITAEGRTVAEPAAADEVKEAAYRSGRVIEDRVAGQSRRQYLETSLRSGISDSTERTGMEPALPIPSRRSSAPVSHGAPPPPVRVLDEAILPETEQIHLTDTSEKTETAAGKSEQLNLPLELPKTSDHERFPEASIYRGMGAADLFKLKLARDLGGTVQTAEGVARPDVGSIPGWVKNSAASIGQGDLSVVQAEAVRSREPEFLFRIADRIHARLMRGNGVIRIQLKPSMLGRLEIHARTATSNVSATIRVESESVKEYLEANLHLLQKGLQDQGFKLDRLHFTVMDDTGPNASTQQDSPGSRTQQDSRAGREKGWTARGSEEEEEITVDAATLAVLAPHSTFHTVA